MSLRSTHWGLVVLALLATAPLSASAQQRILIHPEILRPAPAARVIWHPGIAADEVRSAPIVRITPAFRAADLGVMRDDQTIETPSGNRVPVARMRLIMNALAVARTRPMRAAPFTILPRVLAPCTPPMAGESQAQLLARPPSDVICTPNGKGVSVAQLRLMAPYAASHAPRRGGRLAADAVSFSNIADLRAKSASLRNAPDSTVLVSPKGTRITLGALRAFLRIKLGPVSHGGAR